MVTAFRMFLFIVFLVGMIRGENVFAQDVKSRGDNVPSREDDTLLEIKTRTTNLLEENAELESRYQSLKEELVNLQRTVNQYKKEMKDLNEKQGSFLVKELDDIDLKKDLQGLEGKEKLWRLQWYDLQYQKKELELELQWREYVHKQAQEKEQLMMQILEIDKENQDLEARISDLKRETQMFKK